MQELGQTVQFILLCKTLFQVVLNRFDIMVGGGLDGFDPLRRFQLKILTSLSRKVLAVSLRLAPVEYQRWRPAPGTSESRR